MYYQTFILFLKYKKELIMGKGDIKSKRGKIFNKSYGVRRPKKKKKHNTNISNKRCVYCGVSLLKRSETAKFQAKNKYYPDNGATRDHVPQQCLFEGYSDNFKKNRFVVPCCHKCNLEFSKNEQELRNLIGIANENDEMQDAITQSAVKSILSKKDYEKGLFIDIRGNVKGVEFDLDKFIYNIEKTNPSINIYKIKYKRYNSKKILINKNTYNELFDYIINDCKINNTDISSNDLVISEMYLETKNENVIEKFIDDPFIKIIYDIETVNKLKGIQKIVDKYSDRIIYKLPLFNWKSEKLDEYIKLLENKEIMFTRFSQIYLCKSMRFKKKLIDYTVYVWNKKTLKYLIDNGIEEFTLSPELSYERNKLIFNDISNQAIIAGRLPLVYTRNCFGHLFGCKNCINNQSKLKEIKNEDKNLDFEIYCNDDYRYILNREPILNDYSKVKLASTTKFRYVVSNETINDLNIYIECFKQKNYYNNLKKYSYWKNSYECNILEGKE